MMGQRSLSRKESTALLKIENIKLPPGAGMAELTAEAARLLRVKDFVSLRVLRRRLSQKPRR